MKNNCPAACVCPRRAHEIQLLSCGLGRWRKAAICVLLGLTMLACTTSFGQLVYAMQFNRSNNRFGTINPLTGSVPLNSNFSSADLFFVPEAVLPAPEPGATALSITGGVLLLLITRKRIHC